VCPEALRKTTTESKLVSKPRFEPEIPEFEEVAILTPESSLQIPYEFMRAYSNGQWKRRLYLKLLFSSGKLRLGRYLRNEGNLAGATVCVKPFITYITVTVKCKVRS
jgi:hypothetical protein